jgi:hypothetical protein
LISKEEENEFQLWAFGQIRNLPDFEMMNNWNERHGDKLLLKSDGSIGQDFKKMVELFKKRNIINEEKTG